MTLWHRFHLWRKRRRIMRELREAAVLFDEVGQRDTARRIRDRVEEIRQSYPGCSSKRLADAIDEREVAARRP